MCQSQLDAMAPWGVAQPILIVPSPHRSTWSLVRDYTEEITGGVTHGLYVWTWSQAVTMTVVYRACTITIRTLDAGHHWTPRAFSVTVVYRAQYCTVRHWMLDTIGHHWMLLGMLREKTDHSQPRVSTLADWDSNHCQHHLPGFPKAITSAMPSSDQL